MNWQEFNAGLVLFVLVALLPLAAFGQVTPLNDLQPFLVVDINPDGSMTVTDSAFTLLIRHITSQAPCPDKHKRMLDDPPSFKNCSVLHWKTEIDSQYQTISYILGNYRNPEFNADSTVCNVNEYGSGLTIKSFQVVIEDGRYDTLKSMPFPIGRGWR